MDDATHVILLLLAALFLLWIVVIGPKTKEARAERQRLEAEERARREAERARLWGEQDELLRTIRSRAPDFILRARLEFEREYRSSGGEGIFGQEMSPLVCFGYRVGVTNGRTETERRAVLEYAVAADYDATLPFLPASYRENWGSPLRVTRFNRIYQHLTTWPIFEMVDATSKLRPHIGARMPHGFNCTSVRVWRGIVAFKEFLLVLATVPSSLWADEARTYVHRLGDHIIDYPIDAPEVLDSEMDGFGGQSFIKVKAPEDTEVALTFRRPSQTLHYMEHDWIERTAPASTALALSDVPEFQFGKSKIGDVQKALGADGFNYACRQILPNAGGFLTFLSFEIPSRPDAVYTFVFEHSPDLAKLGLVDATRDGLEDAVLVGTAVIRPSYAVDFWCAERVPYDSKAELPPPPEQQSFADFLPRGGVPVDTDPWAVMTEPDLMICKHGAVTWGDPIHIMPDPADCTKAEIMVWAHTVEDRDLLALQGKAVVASFNLLVLNGVHAPIEQPFTLSKAFYAPIEGRQWPPFAIGSFVFGPFDFQRIIEAENDPSVFGFSLVFGSDVAGMRDNFWSPDGLYKAGAEAIRLCQEANK